MNWKEFTTLIVDSLSDDLLSPTYRKLKKEHPHVNEAFGHCYVAAEAAYYLLGGKEAGWKPQFVRVSGYAHWYLMHESGFIYDPTDGQFAISIPYHEGKGKGFMTKMPSQRCVQLIRQINNSNMWRYLKSSAVLDTQFPKITLEGTKDHGRLDFTH